jgi:hypothetical protein
MIMLSVLSFGAFLLFFLLRNRIIPSQLLIEYQDSDRENIANDWKNVFSDLNVAFNRMNKRENAQ